MNIFIEGSIELPENMSEDDFQIKFLEFLELNNLSFTGVSEEITEDADKGSIDV